jgi:tetratricopeptide (TPR) repeat protein
LAVLVLAGCASTPKPVDPPRLKAALEAESDGAKRHGRGDHAAAARRFDEAARIFASIDDTPGAARNRRHLARAELAQGRAEAALLALDLAERGSGFGVTLGATLDTLLLKAQAQLALGRNADAQQSLAVAAGLCASTCPQAASLHLLQAHAALAGKRALEALTHAEAALKLLQDKDEAAETGNAWRLIAAARLANGDATAALPAAHAALDIDRRLALPEKIGRDWLLIGDIQKRVMRSGIHSDGAGETAANAYRRALDVAKAAGLADIAEIATQALAEVSGGKQAVH